MPRDFASAFTDAFITALLQDLEQTENEQRFEDGKDEIAIYYEDLDENTRRFIARVCLDFYIANEHHILAAGACERDGAYSYYGSVEYAGLDLYRTWSGHGIGFRDSTCWEPEHGEPMAEYAEALAEYVEAVGNFGDIYVGNNGRVYIDGI